MKTMIKTLRFILLIPCAVLNGYITLVVGLLCHSLLLELMCQNRSGSACYDPHWQTVEDILLVVFAAILAALIVITSALLAPVKKVTTVLVIYGLGVCVALLLAIMTGVWQSFIAALVAGGLSTWFVIRHFKAEQL